MTTKMPVNAFWSNLKDRRTFVEVAFETPRVLYVGPVLWKMRNERFIWNHPKSMPTMVVPFLAGGVVETIANA